MSPLTTIDIIDIESSGLSSHSYPIEIGITLCDGQTYTALIRPVRGWDYWDDSAERLHGISKAELMESGKSIYQVCRDINQLCNGRVLYSDGWTYDSTWLNVLFCYAGISPSFRISALDTLFGDNWSSSQWRQMKEQTANSMSTKLHRALTDSMIISKTFFAYQNLLQTRLLNHGQKAKLTL